MSFDDLWIVYINNSDDDNVKDDGYEFDDDDELKQQSIDNDDADEWW